MTETQAQPNPPSTALAVIDGSRFAVARAEGVGVDSLRRLNEVGGTVFDLSQLRVPSGGGSFFQIADEKGELTAPKTIEGVIVAVRGNLKAWYAQSFSDTGGGSQPDCSSGDGLTGTGVRDLPPVPNKPKSRLACAECRYNQFGTARKGAKFGAGKDCQDYALLLFYREGDYLPVVLKVSATSLKALKTYNIFLMGRGRPHTSVTTVLGLESDQSNDGIAYSKLTFKIGSFLDEQASARFRAMEAALIAGPLARFDPATYVEQPDQTPRETAHETVSSTPAS